MSPQAATLYVLIISVPLMAGLLALYVAFSPNPSFAFRASGPAGPIFFIAALIAGVFAHEAIHAIAWAYFGDLPLRRIRFGFLLRTITPYAHAIDPMPARSYRLGTVLPALLLGAVPYVVGMFLSSLALALFGMLFCVAAGGDLLVLWVIRKLDGRVMVRDHPTRVGCVVVTPREP